MHNNDDELWALEWDEREDAFNIRPVSNFFDKNQTSYFAGERVHEYPLAIGLSLESAEEVARIFREARDSFRTTSQGPAALSETVCTTRDIIRRTLEAFGDHPHYLADDDDLIAPD